MTIQALAGETHYRDHLAPIVDQLEQRAFHVERWCRHPRIGWGERWPTGRQSVTARPTIVASQVDYRRTTGPVVWVEHGAGQSYQGDARAALSRSYSGGPGLDRVRLFLCPHETVAQRWRAVYPDVAVVVVGCPKLDPWHTFGPKMAQAAEQGKHGGTSRALVAITFHWPANLCAEAGTAFTHYGERNLARWVAELDHYGIDVIGHAHPSARGRRLLEPVWRRVGIEYVPDWGDVFARADLLVADNTSLLPEFASTGRPVLWLNAPWWRRDVDHGGRFWDWPQGQVMCEHPDELTACTLVALEDPPPVRASREAMVRAIYAATDGRAAERAADAIAAGGWT